MCKMNERVVKIYNELSSILGQPLYLVGGAVRDCLRGVEPKDLDFTTPLLPEVVEGKIRAAGKKAYTVGKRFGTIGVKIEGELVEVTTFRSEKYEEGSRKPIVEFGEHLESDLSRRDFTINAMAWREGRLIDPFGGEQDLKERVVRAVGNPRLRFREDPLRILRLARFCTTLGFAPEKDTLEKATETSHRLLLISKERWVQELDKILVHPNVCVGLTVLRLTRAINFMIPELALQFGYDQKNPHHENDLWTHTCLTVANVSNDIDLRWAALLHDIGKPFVRTFKTPDHCNYIKHDLLGHELVQRLGHHLKWSNVRIEKVSDLVLNHCLETSPLKEADVKAKTRP